jgi:hypothetical protein
VVPDGAGQVAKGVARQQSFQSWSLEPAEKRSVSDFLPTNPLALSGEILQVLWLGMHDVEMGRPGGEDGLLRLSRQSPAKLVFRLMSPPVAASGRVSAARGDGCVSSLAANGSHETIQECGAAAGGDAWPDDVSPAPTSIGASAPTAHGARQR